MEVEQVKGPRPIKPEQSTLSQEALVPSLSELLSSMEQKFDLAFDNLNIIENYMGRLTGASGDRFRPDATKGDFIIVRLEQIDEGLNAFNKRLANLVNICEQLI